MWKSAHVAGFTAILGLAGNAQAMSTPREIGMGQAWAIAQHYAPGRIISAVHARDNRVGRYMFEIVSDGVVREVDVNALTGRPHTAHVHRLGVDPGVSSRAPSHRTYESIRR